MARRDLRRFFPSFTPMLGQNLLCFDFVWSGKMAYSKSIMPYVSKLTSRIYALTGFGVHDMNIAPAGAIVLCEHLLGLSDRIRFFGKIPLHWTGYKFGPMTAESVYRLMAGRDALNQALLKFKRQ